MKMIQIFPAAYFPTFLVFPLEERKNGALQMEAPDFDKRTYLDKSAKLGTLRAKICANLEGAIATVAEQFTPEERKILIKADRLRYLHGDPELWSSDDEEDAHQPSQ
jgi:hypothetical protein